MMLLMDLGPLSDEFAKNTDGENIIIVCESLV